MFCRNCGNEVHEKAVACPKCGVPPRIEKKFCPSCGTGTNPNQVVCTQCGVSLAAQPFSIDTANLPQVDVKGFVKTKAFRYLVAVALVGIGIYAYLQWSSHLREGKAGELISQQFGFPSTVTHPVQHGLIRFTGYDTDVLNVLSRLADKKLIRLTEKRDHRSYFYNTYTTYEIALNPVGLQYKTADSSDREGRQFYIMKTAEKVFGEITSIDESNDGKRAEVEFTWGYTNVTPVGEATGITSTGPGQFKGTVSFVKDNNGWRIADGYDFNDLLNGLNNEFKDLLGR